MRHGIIFPTHTLSKYEKKIEDPGAFQRAITDFV